MTIHFSRYSVGHPWFYYLGGPIQKPSAILARVKADGGTGYLRDEIEQADRMAEPKRSTELRKLRDMVYATLRRDLSIYRRVVRQLCNYRRVHEISDHPSRCDDVHVSMSLKNSHLYNDFAHLVQIDDLLDRQGTLF